MRSKGMFTIVGCVFASALGVVHAQGQGQAAAAFPPCLPQTPAQAQAAAPTGQAQDRGQAQARGPAQPQGERDVAITEIPGIVANGAQDATGKPIMEGPQQTGRTVYTLAMLAQGYKGRAK